ncbi:MAG: phosphoribosylanthranilate isomerase [Thermoleophilia bacterium]
MAAEVRAPVFSQRVVPAVKVCGLTRAADVHAAAVGGAWAVGFVLAESPRRVTMEQAGVLVRSLRDHYPRSAGPLAVGVFVDDCPERVAAVVRTVGFDVVQLHGAESPYQVARIAEAVPEAAVIKVIAVEHGTAAEACILARVRTFAPVADAVLLDTRVRDRVGGTGVSFRWSLAREAARLLPVLVAGGIGPDNAARALAESRAWGIDASSALEVEPGVKDAEAMMRLLRVVEETGALGQPAGPE